MHNDSDSQPVRDPAQAELEYILSFQPHCDRYLGLIANPRGKSVLVIGSGKGTEILWCLKNGAREVVGIDIRPYATKALARALEQAGVEPRVPYKMLTLGVEEAGSLGRRFDLVLSNNVFEHLADVEKAFRVCRNLIQGDDGRIAVFTDPLYHSSMGAHLSGIEPWEHLWSEPGDLQGRVNEWEWKNYLQLNKMTLADFTTAIRANNLTVLKLETVPDRNLQLFEKYRDRINPALSDADLTTEGIAVELKR